LINSTTDTVVGGAIFDFNLDAIHVPLFDFVTIKQNILNNKNLKDYF